MLWSMEIQGEGRDGPADVLRRSLFGQEKQYVKPAGSDTKKTVPE